MHICFTAIDFHSTGDGGGIASYTYALSQALLRRGWQVSVIAKGTQHAHSHLDGIQVFHAPFGNLSWYLYRLGLFRKTLFHVIRELEWSRSIRCAVERLPSTPDLIEGCETGNLFLHSLNIPFVVRLHGESFVFRKHTHQPIHLDLRLARRLEFRFLRQAGAVSSPSAAQGREMAVDLGWQPERIRVIPNPVAAHFVQQGDRAFVSSQQALDVLYVGRLSREKGVTVLLESVPHVARQLPEVHYNIVGRLHNSMTAEQLSAQIAATGYEANIALIGHVVWREMAAWYARAALFVQPSFYETFGIACLEAMCFRLPVVAARVGGLPEVVEDGVTGILVPPNDPQALGEAILSLLRDPEKRRRMGERGREKVLAEFTAERVADLSEAFYREALHEA
ncbi:MAG: glycosyltransferase family 1 protein [Chloroflexi bacterium CFX4]|nr:glycosyltransferase family 1 protein [Chloroflexi bacterium CFX4]MDL1923181.1 glycosyltransferase family 4 protein [Chloroflexi bacterium CFX3]